MSDELPITNNPTTEPQASPDVSASGQSTVARPRPAIRQVDLIFGRVEEDDDDFEFTGFDEVIPTPRGDAPRRVPSERDGDIGAMVASFSLENNRELSLLAAGTPMPVVPSVLSSIMTDALSATNGQATAESVESLRQIVQRYEQTFKQFRQETESAIATFRQQFSDIRRKFETLKRIRQSLVMELVRPRASPDAILTASVVRVGGASANAAASGGSGVRRKRWGKRTSMRRRPDHNPNAGGNITGVGGAGNRF